MKLPVITRCGHNNGFNLYEAMVAQKCGCITHAHSIDPRALHRLGVRRIKVVCTTCLKKERV